MQAAQKSFGKNRNPIRQGQLSKRETILRRYFKMYVNVGKYTNDDFHAYCNWAKDKSEAMLNRELQR